MDFLLLSADPALRDKALAGIKRDVLGPSDPSGLDFESLDGHKLSAEKLKIALYALPGVAARRLVHIYRADKLAKENLQLILDFLSSEHAHATLVLEAEQWDSGTKTRGDITRLLKTAGVEAASAATVFDMMNVVAAGDNVAALRALKELFDQGEAPEKLFGGVLWAWTNRIKARIRPEVYKKGLLVLQEADRALKRSHFPEREYALEILVVKLSLLVKPSKA